MLNSLDEKLNNILYILRNSWIEYIKITSYEDLSEDQLLDYLNDSKESLIIKTSKLKEINSKIKILEFDIVELKSNKKMLVEFINFLRAVYENLIKHHDSLKAFYVKKKFHLNLLSEFYKEVDYFNEVIVEIESPILENL